MAHLKRKLEQPEPVEPKTKQPKIEDATNSKYPPNHPRQIKINNANAAGMCVDAMPANSAKKISKSYRKSISRYIYY